MGLTLYIALFVVYMHGWWMLTNMENTGAMHNGTLRLARVLRNSKAIYTSCASHVERPPHGW